MSQFNSTGQVIASVDPTEIKLDKQIKIVISLKPILARILKAAVAECKDFTYEEIEKSIEGKPEVDVVPIEAISITGLAQEDYQPNEGLIRYDVRTYLKLPNMAASECYKILIDVEAQKDDSPGYDIPVRALYYCCRMISSQYNKEFTTNSNDDKKYGNIKKVYSIWICTETAQYRANCISRYHIDEQMLVGNKSKDVRYDLLEAIIINLSKNHDVGNCSDSTISFLTDLFDDTQTAEEKLSKLETKHHLSVTEEISKEVKSMCTYTSNLKSASLDEGLNIGLNQGLNQGLNLGLKALVRSLKSYCSDFNTLLEAVRKNEEYSNVSEDEVRKYY